MSQFLSDNSIDQMKEYTGTIYSCTFPERQGATSTVTFINSENGQFVCKTASIDPYRDWLAKEAHQMQQLNEHSNLSIPTFLHFWEDEQESHLLMSLEKGVSLRKALQIAETTEKKLKLIKSFGELLQILHKTPAPPLWMKNEPWLDTQLQAAAYNLEHFEVDGDRQLLEQLIANKPTPNKQRLIHGDCTVDNVLVVEGKVQTLIDLAGAAFGDPRYDLALATRSFRNNPRMLEAFYQGYALQTILEEEFAYFDGGLYEFF